MESSPKAVARQLDQMRDRYNRTELRKRRRSVVQDHGIKHRKKDANYKQLLPRIPISPGPGPGGRIKPNYYRERNNSVEPAMTPLPACITSMTPQLRDMKIKL